MRRLASLGTLTFRLLLVQLTFWPRYNRYTSSTRWPERAGQWQRHISSYGSATFIRSCSRPYSSPLLASFGRLLAPLILSGIRHILGRITWCRLDRVGTPCSLMRLVERVLIRLSPLTGVAYFGLSIARGAKIVFTNRKFIWLPLGFVQSGCKSPST
jgi:hypothetical protein